MKFFFDIKIITATAVAIIIFTIGYFILNAPDDRSFVQRASDAASEISEGSDKAIHQLEKRTVGEKLEDTISDANQDIKDSINKK